MSAPVQVLVLGFEEPSTSGEILAELTRLRQAGIVRLLDVLLVTRTEDGSLETQPLPPGADPELGRLAAAFLAEAADHESDLGTDTTDPNAWSIDDVVPRGGAAAVAFIEHTWAQPLVNAVRGAGGQLLDETWLAPEDRERLRDLAQHAHEPLG